MDGIHSVPTSFCSPHFDSRAYIQPRLLPANRQSLNLTENKKELIRIFFFTPVILPCSPSLLNCAPSVFPR